MSAHRHPGVRRGPRRGDRYSPAVAAKPPVHEPRSG